MYSKDEMIFAIIQDMDRDGGDETMVLGLYSTLEKAETIIAKLKEERDANPKRYKYKTDWFIQGYKLDDESSL